jgi:hypothetical protein
MEIPVPKKRNPRMPEAPGLTTRKANATTKPAVRAGLVKEVPTVRCTAEEMQEARVADAEQQISDQEHRLTSLARVASIEDSLRADDDAYTQNANHPLDPQYPTKPEEQEELEGNTGAIFSAIAQDCLTSEQTAHLDLRGGRDSSPEEDFEPLESENDDSDSQEEDSDSEPSRGRTRSLPPKKRRHIRRLLARNPKLNLHAEMLRLRVVLQIG